MSIKTKLLYFVQLLSFFCKAKINWFRFLLLSISKDLYQIVLACKVQTLNHGDLVMHYTNCSNLCRSLPATRFFSLVHQSVGLFLSSSGMSPLPETKKDLETLQSHLWQIQRISARVAAEGAFEIKKPPSG